MDDFILALVILSVQRTCLDKKSYATCKQFMGEKKNAGKSIVTYHTKCNSPAVYHLAEALHSYTK